MVDKIVDAIERGDVEELKRVWVPAWANDVEYVDGDCFLHFAILKGNMEIVTFMLENGSDPNIHVNKTYRAWFDYIDSIDYHIIKKRFILLMRYGANPYEYNESCVNGIDIFHEDDDEGFVESYLVVELVCGEADDFPVDIWRTIKPFIYNV